MDDIDDPFFELPTDDLTDEEIEEENLRALQARLGCED
jgi:hypothetical protein